MAKRHAHPIVRPRSMPVSNFPDYMSYGDKPVPLGWADAPNFLRSLVMAGIAVVVGIMIAPFVWNWLS